jgi:hypothetical protein
VSHWSLAKFLFIRDRASLPGLLARIKCSLRRDRVSQALVAYSCNPSYPGGRNQEDHGLKPAGANSW